MAGSQLVETKALTISAMLGATCLLISTPARADEPPAKPVPVFKVDPVTDGVIVGGALGFTVLSQLVLSTGEIAPQRPGDPDKLLGIDRVAVTQSVDPNAKLVSNIG